MMRTFCTIITSNYFPYAATLYSSLIKFNPDEILNVLVCDNGSLDPDPQKYPGINITRINEMHGYKITDSILHKYVVNADALRWSMKPVFINYLLNKGFENVLLTDCDTFFFNDYNFLFSQLDKSNILLSLHRYTMNPYINEEEFLSHFNFGLFNAGFIGASKKGIHALEWWAKCCEYRIEFNHNLGLHNDQKYLDALPVFFENVNVIDHRGCNIAFWNQHECERTMVNGRLLINKKYPVIFIHFTRKYIPELLEGHDALILPYFREYEKTFKQTGYQISQFILSLPEYIEPNLFIKIKRKLLLRTRIKRWLFKLSQK
jgi:hypothetical protein